MSRFWSAATLVLFTVFGSGPLHAQMPFYTDDSAVTEPGTLHFEIFDEFDGLQSSQFPDLRQNTDNVKVNFSPWKGLELDVDAPYLSIGRAPGAPSSHGIGDTNMGAKWNFRETPPDSLRPALAASFYVEFPTGDVRQGLGSGLTDYWLNLILEKPLSEATRFNVNLGLLFAGNTSTGAVGIHTVGAEIYGGVSDGAGQDKTQLQAMVGIQYEIRDWLSLCLGILGGKYGATPQIGGQLGVAIDLPM
jgi:hypothetical protein